MESNPCFFFFWWVGNKGIKEFSLLCFSFKNHDCVYGLLIKIQFLTFFSDKKLNGYCKCTSSIVFVYPLYARWPSEFDRFWILFMCAAGELRVRYIYLYVLVVGIVLITKGKRAKILFIETNNLLLLRKFGIIKNFTCGLYLEVFYHVCQLLLTGSRKFVGLKL